MTNIHPTRITHLVHTPLVYLSHPRKAAALFGLSHLLIVMVSIRWCLSRCTWIP